MSRVGLLLIVSLLALGARVTYDRVWGVSSEPVPLRKPFSEFTLTGVLPQWSEVRHSLSDEVVQRSGASEYIYNLYRHENPAKSFWLWVGYVPVWQPGSIHHPGVCYPGSGQRSVGEPRTIEVSVPGREQPARFDEIRWIREPSTRTYTLSTFYYLGEFRPGEVQMRASAVRGIRYFAMIIVSGQDAGDPDEDRERFGGIVAKVLPRLLEHLPDGEPVPAEGDGELGGEVGRHGGGGADTVPPGR